MFLIAASGLANSDDSNVKSPAWIGFQQKVFESARSGRAFSVEKEWAKPIPTEFQHWLDVDSNVFLAELSRPMPGATSLSGALQCELAPSLSLTELQNGALFTESTDAKPRWIKLQLAKAQQWTLIAFAIDDDTALSAFVACDSPALGSSDDAIMLLSKLTINAGTIPAVWIKLDRAIGKSTQLSALQTGRISGSVSVPVTLPNGRVSAFNAVGTHIASSTVVNNRYELEMPPGSYYIKANYLRTVSQVYDNVECASEGVLSCNLSAAALLPLASNQQLANVNFLMDTGAIVAGRIFDEETGIGINASVSTANSTAFAQTDAVGRYVMRLVPSGEVGVTASAYRDIDQPERYLAQRYRNRNCPNDLPQSCSLTLNDPIFISRGETRLGIDFPLRRVSTISGTLISPQWPILIEVINNAGIVVAGTNGFSNYVVSDIPVGSYRVRFGNGTSRMLYPNLVCSQADCSDRLAEATVVTITSNRTSLVNVDATFNSTRFLTGRVLDRSTGTPISSQVTLRNANGVTLSAYAGNGEFFFADPPIGPISLFASSMSHIDAYYPDIDCQAPLQTACNTSTSGSTNFIVSATGNSSAEFRLLRGASVSGKYLRASGKQHSDFSLVPNIQTTNGATVSIPQSQTPLPFSYRINDLQPGSYFVNIIQNNRYFMPVARQITLIPEQMLTGLDFTVLARFDFEGRVTDAAGIAIAGVALDFWHNSQLITTAQTDVNGWYFSFGNVQLNESPIRISTDAPQALTNQIYQGISCPLGPVYSGLCNLRQGSEIAVPAIVPSDHLINFQLSPAGSTDQIFFGDFEIGISQRSSRN